MSLPVIARQGPQSSPLQANYNEFVTTSTKKYRNLVYTWEENLSPLLQCSRYFRSVAVRTCYVMCFLQVRTAVSRNSYLFLCCDDLFSYKTRGVKAVWYIRRQKTSSSLYLNNKCKWHPTNYGLSFPTQRVNLHTAKNFMYAECSPEVFSFVQFLHFYVNENNVLG